MSIMYVEGGFVKKADFTQLVLNFVIFFSEFGSNIDENVGIGNMLIISRSRDITII